MDETFESFCNGFVNKEFYVFAKVECKDLFKKGFQVSQCSKLNNKNGPGLEIIDAFKQDGIKRGDELATDYQLTRTLCYVLQIVGTNQASTEHEKVKELIEKTPQRRFHNKTLPRNKTLQQLFDDPVPEDTLLSNALNV